MSMEYLLSSRAVFSALTTPLQLKHLHLMAPAVVVLWSLSPLGGQGSLRVISTEPSGILIHANITYLGFVSPFTNEGVGSASAGPLVPINAAFTSSMASSRAAKLAPQDLFGNVKVPMLESLTDTIGREDFTS